VTLQESACKVKRSRPALPEFFRVPLPQRFVAFQLKRKDSLMNDSRNPKFKPNLIPKMLFDVVPGTDGVDDTFDVVCRFTEHTVARLSYWHQKRESKRRAERFAKALSDVYWNGYVDALGFEMSRQAMDLLFGPFDSEPIATHSIGDEGVQP
jgi:hypothetical protein